MNELKYLHYINFVLNANEILLELKTASLTCRGRFFSSCLYKYLSHVGSNEELSLYNRRCGVCVSPLFVA